MPIRSQWQKGKLIGRGAFGSVYVDSNRETEALCAMEAEILPEDVKSQERMRQLQQEINLNGEAAYLSLKVSRCSLAPELLQPVTPPKDASGKAPLERLRRGCSIVQGFEGYSTETRNSPRRARILPASARCSHHPVM
ncbi:hypothetical protein OROGR_009375 [Orobanche gracilis]